MKVEVNIDKEELIDAVMDYTYNSLGDILNVKLERVSFLTTPEGEILGAKITLKKEE